MRKASNSGKASSATKQMPNVFVGGVEMKWDDYWAMIKEMENLQIPFKQWIEKEFEPAYKKFLRDNFSVRVAKSHADVAAIFFERVLHVGFLNFEEIRPAFAVKEFPRWWNTHVIGYGINTKQIESSIRKLLSFAKEVYKLEPLGKKSKIVN